MQPIEERKWPPVPVKSEPEDVWETTEDWLWRVLLGIFALVGVLVLADNIVKTAARQDSCAAYAATLGQDQILAGWQALKEMGCKPSDLQNRLQSR